MSEIPTESVDSKLYKHYLKIMMKELFEVSSRKETDEFVRLNKEGSVGFWVSVKLNRLSKSISDYRKLSNSENAYIVYVNFIQLKEYMTSPDLDWDNCTMSIEQITNIIKVLNKYETFITNNCDTQDMNTCDTIISNVLNTDPTIMLVIISILVIIYCVIDNIV